MIPIAMFSGVHHRQKRVDFLRQDGIGEPSHQGDRRAQVWNHVGRAGEDPDSDRPTGGDAHEREKQRHGKAQQGALEEDAAHVVTQRAVEIRQDR